MAKKEPIRKCMACGEHKIKSEFVKVLRSAKNSNEIKFSVIPGDFKKDGRGAYICLSEKCFNRAKKTRRLNQIFKRKVEDLVYDELERAVMRSG